MKRLLVALMAASLAALGDSLLGGPIAAVLGLPPDTARELSAKRLRQHLGEERMDV